MNLKHIYNKLLVKSINIFPLNSSTPYPILIKHFIEKSESLKIINLQEASAIDIQALSELGYSQEYLKKMFNKSVFTHRRDIRRIIETIEFHEEFILGDSISSFCPISGKKLYTQLSFCPNLKRFHTIAYFFSGVKDFYLLIGDYWGEKLGLYIPEDNLVIQFKNVPYKMPLYIAYYKAFLLKYESLVNKYKQSKNHNKAIAIYHDHFAHHIWNDLSGIQNYIEQANIETLGKLYVVSSPLGDILKIFPEISDTRIEIVSPHNLAVKVLKNNSFIIPAKNVIIQEALINRIYTYYNKSVSKEMSEIIECFKKKNTIKIWISIRENSRTWIDQFDGIVNILNTLGEKYGTMGIVFDGFTLPFSVQKFETEHFNQLIKKEIQLVERINLKLNLKHNIQILSGKRMDEALLWAKVTDVYFVHYGTIQHKIGWFANKPGVVHSNTIILNQDINRRPGSLERENSVLPKYLDAKYVTDVNESVLNKAGKVVKGNQINYNFSWQVAYTEIEKLIEDKLFSTRINNNS